MQKLTTANLIENIQNRELKIELTKLELIKLWFIQGRDLIVLSDALNIAYVDLVPIVSISKSSIYNYIAIAKDERIEKLLPFSTNGNSETESKHIENFNQKDIVRLSYLNDVEFTQVLIDGKFPTAKTEPPITSELSLDEEILFKEGQVKILIDEIGVLKEKRVDEVDKIIDVKIIENKHINKVNKAKTVEQVDKDTGKVINTYKSVSKASSSTGFSPSSISKCASGKQKEAHGFKWQYKDN